MSLTKIIKNRVPRIDPWGTPHLRVCSADSSPLKLTYCVRSVFKVNEYRDDKVIRID